MKSEGGRRDGNRSAELNESRIPNPGSSLNHRQDVFFAHDQKLLAVDFHFGTAVLAEQDPVALLDGDRTDFAVLENLAVAGGDDFAANRLFGGRIGDHDAAGGD